MAEKHPWAPSWIDALFFILLIGLALLSPIREIHKQLTLLAIGVFQLLEGTVIAKLPRRGRAYSVLIKILLATLLIDHTGALASIALIIRSTICPSSPLQFTTALWGQSFGPPWHRSPILHSSFPRFRNMS